MNSSEAAGRDLLADWRAWLDRHLGDQELQAACRRIGGHLAAAAESEVS